MAREIRHRETEAVGRVRPAHSEIPGVRGMSQASPPLPKECWMAREIRRPGIEARHREVEATGRVRPAHSEIPGVRGDVAGIPPLSKEMIDG
jgi:hypothetical protein